MSRKIYIFISDIASFIGQNKWDYITPFERLWKKCDREGYQRVIEHYKTTLVTYNQELDNITLEKGYLESDFKAQKITSRQYSKKLEELTKKEDCINNERITTQKYVDNIDLTQKEKLEKHIGKSNIETIESDNTTTTNKKKLVNNFVNELNLDEATRRETLKSAESYINKTHGTLKEESAIHMFEKKFNVSLDTSQQFNSKVLPAPSQFQWYICGKCDGLYITKDPKESYIVEVKNRTKSFFNRLREYENTQIQLYMWMLHINQTKLVEKLDSKIRITNVKRDDLYINNVLEYLNIFTHNFENKFLTSFDKQLEYVAQPQHEKQVFLQKLYLNEIKKLELQKLNDGNTDSDNDCMISDTI